MGLAGLTCWPGFQGLAGKFASGGNGGAGLCVFMHIANSGFRVRVRQFFLANPRRLWVARAFFRGHLRAFGDGVAGPTVLHTNPEGWRT